MNKRLLYLTNNQLAAYEWRAGKLLYPPRVFSLDPQAQPEFAAYLREQPRHALLLLTDLIEENFQRDHIPHVHGEAHRNLLNRRLTQLYRETPFRHASREEREKTGRKDDLILFSALTNAQLVQPWLKTIQHEKAPLAGIYSIALLGPLLFRRLKLDIEHLLLVTRQSNGLRQSYFLHGRLRFSRLVPLYDDSTDEIAQKMVLEINKTRQFLASTRLLSRDENINIGILADGEVLQAIEQANEELSLQHHQYFDLAQACQLLGLHVDGTLSFSDHLFLSVLAKHSPVNQYAPPGFNRHLQLLQVQALCWGLAAVFTLTGLVWSASDAWQAWQERRAAKEFDAQAQQAKQQYEQVIASLPSTVGNPHDMKSAVDIEEMISKNAAQPLPLFRQISSVLNRQTNVRINQMHWIVSDIETLNVDGAAPQVHQAIANAPQPSPAHIGLPKPPFQTMLIEGEVQPFQHDFRHAMEVVKQFSQELSKIKQAKVMVQQWPLDILPSSGIRGKAGNEDPDAKAKFTLKITWNPN